MRDSGLSRSFSPSRGARPMSRQRPSSQRVLSRRRRNRSPSLDSLGRHRSPSLDSLGRHRSPSVDSFGRPRSMIRGRDSRSQSPPHSYRQQSPQNSLDEPPRRRGFAQRRSPPSYSPGRKFGSSLRSHSRSSPNEDYFDDEYGQLVVRRNPPRGKPRLDSFEDSRNYGQRRGNSFDDSFDRCPPKYQQMGKRNSFNDSFDNPPHSTRSGLNGHNEFPGDLPFQGEPAVD
eukprot:scaffold189673_cov20-Cyclotella_meneghiniana.AAC.1